MNKNNKFFFGMILFSVVSFITVGIIGNRQYEENSDEFIKYNGYLELIDKGEKLDEAFEYVEYMQNKDRNNYTFNVDKASIYIKRKDYKNASIEYRNAMEKNKSLNQNAKFLIQYAETAYKGSDYNTSKNVIKKIKKLKIDNKINNKVNKILSSINK